MKCYAMLKIGETGWIEKEMPKCGPLDAICRPLALAPCTSDVHTVWAGAIGERENMVLGHEAVGEVVEVGELVRDFKHLNLDFELITDESGKNYVYLQGEDGLLKKQYVKVGKSLWGYYLEITSGVTLQDKIAFPYGKNVSEGAPTNEVENLEESAFYG